MIGVNVGRAATFTDKEIKAQFGAKLSELRKAKCLTRKQLAAALNLSEVTITSYEGGKRQPSFEIIFELANFFGVTVDELLGHSGITRNRIIEDYQLDEAIHLLLNVGTISISNASPPSFALSVPVKGEKFQTDADGNVKRTEPVKDAILFRSAEDLIDFAEELQKRATFSEQSFQAVFEEVAENLFVDAEQISRGEKIFSVFQKSDDFTNFSKVKL